MKIIILDDHKIFGESLQNLLLESDDINICDFVSDIEGFYKKIETDTYVDYKTNKFISKFTTSKIASLDLKNCATHLLLEKYQKEALIFTDLKTLSERIKNNNFILLHKPNLQEKSPRPWSCRIYIKVHRF